MRTIMFLVIVLFLSGSICAWVPKEDTYNRATSGFGECSFKKMEKDNDGITAFLSCGKMIGEKKCYVQKDRKGYKELESGDIWKKLNNKTLTVTRDENYGRQKINKIHKDGRIEGWFIGDCIAFYTKDMAYDFIKGKYMEAKKDNIDLAFNDHPEVLGKWSFVDYVVEVDEFKPTDKKWKGGNHYFKEVVFLNNGKTNKPYITWTKEVLIHKNDVTASKYEIKTMDGDDYLFIQEKNGDYIYRHEDPKYVVFKRTGNKKNKK